MTASLLFHQRYKVAVLTPACLANSCADTDAIPRFFSRRYAAPRTACFFASLLGRAIAEAVLAAGDTLIATARHPQQLSDLVERYGDNVRAVALDVTDERAAIAAVQLAVDVFGRLDVLVNNAGYGNLAAIEDTTMQDFRAQLETNLFVVVNLTKAAFPVMRRQGAGRILQFSSVGGRVGPIGRGAYAAAKWGVEGFSEVLAKEVGPLGIKVTIIEPGGFRTDFAGSSQTILADDPAYAATVGAVARFQREYA